jgi:hypothetical protein
MFLRVYIVTCRPNSTQRPKYAHATIENLLEEVFSMWSAPCPVLGNGSIDTHSDTEEVFSMWSAPCPVLGNGSIDTHSDTEEVFSMWPAPCPLLGNGPMNTHSDMWLVFSVRSDPGLYNESTRVTVLESNPCGGGVEYLHHDPASRRRRWKGKSQMWDSKIRSREWLRWQGPAAYIKDRPVLSSERAPHKNKAVTVKH